MIRAHRVRHRWTFYLLAPALPLLFAAALWVRPEHPVNADLPAGVDLFRDSESAVSHAPPSGAAGDGLTIEVSPAGASSVRLVAELRRASSSGPFLLYLRACDVDRGMAPGSGDLLVGRLTAGARESFEVPAGELAGCRQAAVWNFRAGTVVAETQVSELPTSGGRP